MEASARHVGIVGLPEARLSSARVTAEAVPFARERTIPANSPSLKPNEKPAPTMTPPPAAPSASATASTPSSRKTPAPATDPLRGLAALLVMQVCGEGLARGLDLPFPGPVVGMLLLMPALALRSVREPVALCADFLLRHLSLLFVPVGVGVMSHLDLISHFGGRMLLVIVLSTWAGIMTTAWVLKRSDPPAPPMQPSAPVPPGTEHPHG